MWIDEQRKKSVGIKVLRDRKEITKSWKKHLFSQTFSNYDGILLFPVWGKIKREKKRRRRTLAVAARTSGRYNDCG